LRVGGDRNGERNGGKEENCFAETHVGLVY
jgi:hypothetical protein